MANKLDVKFGLHSTIAGLYIRLIKNGTSYSVDANGNADTEDNARWNLYLLGANRMLFENVEYEGIYLMLSALGNHTILSGHDINVPLTRDDVEMLLGLERASGDGEQLLTTDEANDEDDFFVSAEWQNDSVSPLVLRFKVVAENGQDCFLAFDKFGEQVKDLCDVPENSPEVMLKLLPLF